MAVAATWARDTYGELHKIGGGLEILRIQALGTDLISKTVVSKVPRPTWKTSRVVISMFISPLVWVFTIVTLLIAPRKTTHEPPSKL